VLCEYPIRRLGDLTVNFDGKRVPVKEADRARGPYPYYGASGIVDCVDAYLFDGEYLLIAEDGENLRTRQTPIAFMAKGRFWVNNHAHVVQANGGNSTRYLMYALLAANVHAFLSGSTLPKLTQNAMNQIPVPSPDERTQRAIACILGALDDKIELNRKMNQTLEGIARAIFKSWFVDFLPVCAKAEGRDPGLPSEIADLFPSSFVDSELGPIPEGWGVSTFGNAAEVSSGKRPTVRYEVPSEMASVPLWGGNGPMAYVPAPLVDYPALLTGRVGTLGSVFRINSPCWPSDNTLVLRARRSRSLEYLYFQLLLVDFPSLNRGSTQPLLTQSDLKAQSMPMPPDRVLGRFHDVAKYLFQRTDASDSESHTLVSLRDTLLPKLISGELRVPDAERIVGRCV